jgi:hypothetical protein
MVSLLKRCAEDELKMKEEEKKQKMETLTDEYSSDNDDDESEEEEEFEDLPMVDKISRLITVDCIPCGEIRTQMFNGSDHSDEICMAFGFLHGCDEEFSCSGVIQEPQDKELAAAYIVRLMNQDKKIIEHVEFLLRRQKAMIAFDSIVEATIKKRSL